MQKLQKNNKLKCTYIFIPIGRRTVAPAGQGWPPRAGDCDW